MRQSTKEHFREVAKLILNLSVFAGIGLLIVTAAGIEQDLIPLSGHRWILWGAGSLLLMVIGAAGSAYMDYRRDED